MADQHTPEERERILNRIAHEQPPPAAEPVRAPSGPALIDDSPMWTLISAALFLYVGFYRVYVPLTDEPTVYNLSLPVFTWMARIVGIGLLLVAAAMFFRVPGARPLDFFLALLAAAGCLGVGLIWIVNGDGDGYLVALFGLVNAMAARSSWFAWKGR